MEQEKQKITMTKQDKESWEIDFDYKIMKLFTQGGLMTLMDYPPHDMVLDEIEVKKFIKSLIEEREREAYKRGYNDARRPKGELGSYESIQQQNKPIGSDNGFSIAPHTR